VDSGVLAGLLAGPDLGERLATALGGGEPYERPGSGLLLTAEQWAAYDEWQALAARQAARYGAAYGAAARGAAGPW
jgi:hypothetical protein